MESKNENFQSKLNYSQTDDLNLSTITSVSFEESFTENTRYDFEYEDQEVIEEIELLTKEISFSFEKSSMENSIENFQVSQLNLSLCEFDDSLIGNGNTNFLEFYQEKE